MAGWNLHPQEKRRLTTAHTHSRRSGFDQQTCMIKNSDAGTLLGRKNEGGRYLRTNGPVAIAFRSGECHDDCRQSSAIRPGHADFRSIQEVNASFRVNHLR